VLDGKLSGYLNGAPTNMRGGRKGHCLSGCRRNGSALHRAAPEDDRRRRILGTAGNASRGDARIRHRGDGYPVTHVYRSAFPRSSGFVHLRPQPPGSVGADDMKAAAS